MKNATLTKSNATVWNPRIGLWRRLGSGHCVSVSKNQSVHSGPEAAMKLLICAQRNDFTGVNAMRVLEGLRKTQFVGNSPNQGGFRWYIEETDLQDDHAVFFNGMSLLVLWAGHSDAFNTAERLLMRDILCDAGQFCLQRMRQDRVYYPNEYLGYAVCAYLAAEFFDDASSSLPEIIERLETSMDYWLANGWGWGEHLSNIYGRVCLDELSILLLFAEKLPDVLHAKAKQLFIDLHRLETEFHNGPRVPTIRDYSFTNIPRGLFYPDLIKPLPTDMTFEPYLGEGSRLPVCSAPFLTAAAEVWYPLGASLHQNGWHDKLGSMLNHDRPTSTPANDDVEPIEFTTQCFNDITAHSYVNQNVRMGSLSEFPIMPTMEGLNAGLSWQCFPIATWVQSHLWSYMQWATVENGTKRSHPAREKRTAYLHNSLTDTVIPPLVGRTYCLQHGPELLCLRYMPRLSLRWQSLVDQVRLIHDPSVRMHQNNFEHWCSLEVSADDRRLYYAHTAPPQWRSPTPVLKPAKAIAESKTHEMTVPWAVEYLADPAISMPIAASIWAVSLDKAIESQPVFQTLPTTVQAPPNVDTPAFTLEWRMARHHWNVVVDLNSPMPLREC